jgi:hypothetical protein
MSAVFCRRTGHYLAAPEKAREEVTDLAVGHDRAQPGLSWAVYHDARSNRNWFERAIRWVFLPRVTVVETTYRVLVCYHE